MVEGVDGVDDGGAGARARWHALAAVRDDAVRSLHGGVVRPDDVEDCVQEAMIRLATRELPDLEPGRLRALLVRVASNVAIDRHRRAGRYRQLLPLLHDDAGAVSPEEIVTDRGEARWLAARMTELGALERRALAHAAAGRRLDEIAAALGVEYKAAENALGRARRKLRMRAWGVTVGVTALLRRLRLAANHDAALNAVALAAAVLLLGTGGPNPVTAAAAGRPSRVGSAAVAPAQIAASVPRAATASATVRVTRQPVAHQQSTLRQTPAPQPSPSLVPLQNCGSHVPRGVWAPVLNPVYSEATCLTNGQWLPGG
jgi:RNA polymerase sigma factor (sigma-70 family)